MEKYLIAKELQIMETEITLRDWFAGQAAIARVQRNNSSSRFSKSDALFCWHVADALIEARDLSTEKPPKQFLKRFHGMHNETVLSEAEAEALRKVK